MMFGFGSEFGDIIYRLQKPNDNYSDNYRWCVFSVDRNYYVIKQQKVNDRWDEEWTKQMNYDLLEAKQYA